MIPNGQSARPAGLSSSCSLGDFAMRLLHCPFAAACSAVLWIAGAVITADQAAAASPDPIDRLIQQLGSDDFETREAASKELKGIGEPAVPPLHKATESHDSEIRRRAQELVEAIERPLAAKARAAFDALGAIIRPDQDYPDLLRIEFDNGKASDTELCQLKYLGDVGYLTISGPDVTDGGLAVLGDLRKLRELNLYCPKMTDAGLVHVKGLRNLTRLGLGGPKMTDAGLLNLKDLRHLESLSLGSDGITNDGLACLAGLGELRELSFGSLAVTDDGFRHLAGLGNLKSLQLVYTGVTGAGLAHLKALDRLERLDLGDAATDDGLKALEGCTGLEILCLGGNKINDKITDKGMTHLRDFTPSPPWTSSGCRSRTPVSRS
jgi:hypothetical protein